MVKIKEQQRYEAKPSLGKNCDQFCVVKKINLSDKLHVEMN